MCLSVSGNVLLNIWGIRPFGFDPSRINPHIIKNLLADRCLVLSGENAVCIGYSSDSLAAKGHVKGKRLTGELK